MKGGGGTGVYQGKRRWRCLAIGVLFLVLLSMLVPLVFLLGLYNGFHSTGYLSDQSTTASTSTAQSRHVDRLLKKLGPTFPKLERFRVEGFLRRNLQVVRINAIDMKDTRASSMIEGKNHMRPSVEGSEKNCELRFGSHCLWREENREDMKYSMVKKLKDQLFVARAYYPSIAKLPSQNKLSRKLRQNIQEVERVLSESTTDADLPPIRWKIWSHPPLAIISKIICQKDTG